MVHISPPSLSIDGVEGMRSAGRKSSQAGPGRIAVLFAFWH